MHAIRDVVRSVALALICLLAVPASAGSANASFFISVTLTPASAQATHGYCSVPASAATAGATVKVVCGTTLVGSLGVPADTSPWTPIHGGALEYSFVDAGDRSTGVSTRFDPVPRFVSGFDVYSMSGTITGWRVINTPSLSYIEFQINL